MSPRLGLASHESSSSVREVLVEDEWSPRLPSEGVSRSRRCRISSRSCSLRRSARLSLRLAAPARARASLQLRGMGRTAWRPLAGGRGRRLGRRAQPARRAIAWRVSACEPAALPGRGRRWGRQSRPGCLRIRAASVDTRGKYAGRQMRRRAVVGTLVLSRTGRYGDGPGGVIIGDRSAPARRRAPPPGPRSRAPPSPTSRSEARPPAPGAAAG